MAPLVRAVIARKEGPGSGVVVASCNASPAAARSAARCCSRSERSSLCGTAAGPSGLQALRTLGACTPFRDSRFLSVLPPPSQITIPAGKERKRLWGAWTLNASFTTAFCVIGGLSFRNIDLVHSGMLGLCIVGTIILVAILFVSSVFVMLGKDLFKHGMSVSFRVGCTVGANVTAFIVLLYTAVITSYLAKAGAQFGATSVLAYSARLPPPNRTPAHSAPLQSTHARISSTASFCSGIGTTWCPPPSTRAARTLRASSQPPHHPPPPPPPPITPPPRKLNHTHRHRSERRPQATPPTRGCELRRSAGRPGAQSVRACDRVEPRAQSTRAIAL